MDVIARYIALQGGENMEHPQITRTLKTGYPTASENRCRECRQNAWEEEWYPEIDIRYQGRCTNCGHSVTEYDD